MAAEVTSSRRGAAIRSARRSREGGAVMFIVAMTLAMIAAMGVYALQIASTEVKTAGFVRQQVQTQYLSQFGVISAAQALNGTNAQLYNTLMMQSTDTGCFSLYGFSSLTSSAQALACHRAGSTELGTQVVLAGAAPVTLIVPYGTVASEPDLVVGSVGLNTFPDFYVEMTDPNQRQPPPGYATNSNLCFVQFTASAMGLTPTTKTTDTADTFMGNTTYGYLSEDMTVARARIMGGPVTCSGTN
jgi:hypothetical protein